MKKNINVKLLPSEANSGIVFKRVDLKKDNIVRVDFNNVFIENDKLVLRNSNETLVNGIELFLTAVWAAKIDNMIVEIDGDSIPYIDGTSEPFLFLLTICKTKELEKSKIVFELENEICLKVDDFEIAIQNNKFLSITAQNSKESFTFDNEILPYKDWLSRINENTKEVSKFNILSTIAIIFLSGKFCPIKVEIKNFDKKRVYEFFKNLFGKC